MLRALALAAAAGSGAAVAATPPPPAPSSTAQPPAPRPVPDRPPLSFDVPRMIAEVEVPGTMKALGVPVKLRAVKSAATAFELGQYFVAAFERAGLYIPPEKHQLRILDLPQLTALDVQTLVAYSVILQPNTDATTTVFLGTAKLQERQRLPGPGFAPLFPGAKSVVQSNVEGADLLVYEASGTPGEVQAFYRDALPKEGYTEEKPGTFRKAGTELRVSTHVKEGRMNVLLMRRLVE